MEVGVEEEWFTEKSGRNKVELTLAVSTDWSGSDLSNNLLSLAEVSLTDSLDCEVLAR